MIGRHGGGARAPPHSLPRLPSSLMGGENHPPPCAPSWHVGGTATQTAQTLPESQSGTDRTPDPVSSRCVAQNLQMFFFE